MPWGGKARRWGCTSAPVSFPAATSAVIGPIRRCTRWLILRSSVGLRQGWGLLSGRQGLIPPAAHSVCGGLHLRLSLLLINLASAARLFHDTPAPPLQRVNRILQGQQAVSMFVSCICLCARDMRTNQRAY